MSSRKKKPTKQVRSIEAMHANYIAGSSTLRKKFQKTEMNSGIQSSQHAKFKSKHA
jgi:hypothetical protein